MREKAVIDRFEDGWAVLLVGEAARKVDVRREALPEGAREGQWLRVEMEGDALVRAEVDEDETARAKQRIMEKLERLRRGDHLS